MRDMPEWHAQFDPQAQTTPSPMIPSFVNNGCWEGEGVAFANIPKFANAHAGYNIYRLMNVDRLHQLLECLFKEYTWDLIVGCLKNIYGQENGFNLIDKQFSKIPHFADLCQFGDKVPFVIKSTGTE